MSMHFRMIDALAEAHLMACTQKKSDVAELLLKAIELESDKYGAQHPERRSGNMLDIARERQAGVRLQGTPRE